jgi:hypothetical protein
VSGLPKVPITWPLAGGLAGASNPLSVAPGSHLLLDNVIQERIDEWRVRQGFTQSATDSQPLSVDRFWVGKRGSTGLVSLDADRGWSQFSPSLGSNRWSTVGGKTQAAETLTRTAIADADTTTIGFAVNDSFYLVGHLSSAAGVGRNLVLFDRVAKVPVSTTTMSATALRIRGAATSTHLCMFIADTGGNLSSFVVNASTGVVTGPTVIKTGLHATQPYLDAIWYGGSTITIVCRTSGDAVRFIEFNPSTGALATDTTLAAVSCANCLSLFHDPDASGLRMVANSHTTPTTRVQRVNSAGAIQSDDQVENIASSQIAGIATTAGADWSVVYRRSSDGQLRYNNKSGGVVGTAGLVQNNSHALELDSQMWSEPVTAGVNSETRYLVGLHSNTTADPQDTWVEVAFSGKGQSSGNIFDPRASLVPLQGAASLTAVAASLYQVVRTGSRTAAFALPVLSHYTNDAGTISRRYSIDVFEQRLLIGSDIGSAAGINIGPALDFLGRTTMFPGGVCCYSDEGWIRNLGTYFRPPIPTLSQSAGGALTLLATYGYRLTIEAHDEDGRIWRSPPSPPVFVTLTGANNRVVVDISRYANWTAIQERGRQFRLVFWRTAANGSQYRRYKTLDVSTGTTYNDDAADSAIINGEVLYTAGELPTALTPAPSHLALFGDRLWAVNRDFRTELACTKRLRPGRQPEFIDAGTVDIDDAFGDITGLASIDDKGVVFKRNAIYFLQGDGLEDNGAGQVHTYAQVTQDYGALPGTPIVVAGDVIYFVSERGVHTIDRGGNIEWVGAGIDQYLGQPQINTPETVFDGCFIPEQNEVRLLTTNYILVHNRTWNTWTRWTGLSGMRRCAVIAGRMWLFKSDGTVWREGDYTQLTDQGAAITGRIRTAWIRVNEGQIRLYKGGVVMTRTAGGGSVSPSLGIYFDYDDSTLETFAPSSAIPGAKLLVNGTAQPRRHRCTAFSYEATLPAGDKTCRMSRWLALIGPKKGSRNRGAADRWT